MRFLLQAESKFQKHGVAKSIEKDLLHIQDCTLDVVRPLLDIIEGVNSGQLTPPDVKEQAADFCHYFSDQTKKNPKNLYITQIFRP